MDRLRRSLRSSIKRKKHRDGGSAGAGSAAMASGAAATQSADGKANVWKADEISVRSGTCSFSVKYLGCVEVFESRGMQVCEEAVKVLKNSKRKSVRAILYVHGDGLRVVDDDTKGLVVDQTIEKVSFCAPDRNFERGFSYICRDGTTRRWMCHGFMAARESGERLSHAVGCAFAICLEKKQERDRLASGVSMSFNKEDASFTRFGSFRQATITERLTDPQGLKPNTEPPPLEKVDNPFAVARPHATDLMLARQTSFRGFNSAQAQSPFKRNLSLRLNDLPSTLERQMRDSTSSSDLYPLPDVIVEGEEEEYEAEQQQQSFGGGAARSTSLRGLGGGLGDLLEEEEAKLKQSQNQTGPAVPVQVLKSHLSQLYQLSENAQRAANNPFQQELNSLRATNADFNSQFGAIAEETEEAPAVKQDPIDSMCQQLSAELSVINNSNKENVANNNHSQRGSGDGAVAVAAGNNNRSASVEPLPPMLNNGDNNSQPLSLPYIPPVILPTPAANPANGTHSPEEPSKDPLANVKPVQYDNPWDFVPDQPCINKPIVVTTTTIASTVTTSKPKTTLNGDSASVNSSDASDTSASSSSGGAEVNWFQKTEPVAPQEQVQKVDLWATSSAPGEGILEDPFDAEWAALATRNNMDESTKANPFERDQFGASKSFEMQM